MKNEKMKKKQLICIRILAALLSFATGVSTILSNPIIVYAVEGKTGEEENGLTQVVQIETAQELKTIATNSVNDTYTLHKKFVLQKDIDLSGMDYQPIAIFAGELDGNGHTIKGLKLNNFGANSGLIQYVEKTGIVSNLTVEGDILQTEKKENIGGIAGTNKGTIQNCTFTGKIIAQQCVGGIAGYNKETGRIIDCSNEGTLTGTKRTGGMVGKNEGIVENCVNQGKINTTDQTVYDFGEEETTDFTMPSLSTDREQIKKDLQDDKKINYIGGIAGVSSGTVTNCENFATIGHEHMGYTIGGIVGYERGILTHSNNYGQIYGRKDIGGIAGILEPLVEIDYLEDTTSKIQDQMDAMMNLMDGLSDKSRAGGDAATSDVDQIRDSVKDMRQIIRNHKEYYDKRADVFDDGLDSRINSIDQIIEDLDFNLDDDKVKSAVNELKSDGEKLSALMMKIQTSQTKISYIQMQILLQMLAGSGTTSPGAPTPLVSQPMVTADDSILTDDKKDTDTVEDESQKNEETETGNEGESADTETGNEGESADTETGNEGGSADTGTGNEGESADAGTGNEGESADTGTGNEGESIDAGTGNEGESIDAGTESEGGESRERSFHIQVNAGAAGTLTDLKSTADQEFANMSSYAAEAEKILKHMSEQGNIISQVMDQATNEKTQFKEDLSDLDDHLEEFRFFLRSQRDSLKKDLDKTDDEITAQSDKISTWMDQLSNDLKSAKADIREQMDLIQDQMHLLNDTVGEGMDELRDKLNKDWEKEDPIKDISDTDDRTPSRGKIISCKNEGEIVSDMNGGGIVGSMAVVSDAETDFEIVETGERSLKVEKKEMAAIMDCKNLSDITVRNDYAGGIVGRSEMGAVIASENYGNIETTDGDYAGGIVGKSKYMIRNSYSLCDITGNDYCGGIAGYGTSIKNNIAMVGIQNEDGGSKGTIAGDMDEDGEAAENFFVEEGIGAIAGLSYEKQATPLKYEALIAKEEIPPEFYTFQIKFVVDNRVVKRILCKYGDNIDAKDYPEVPLKDGKVGFWENVDLSNINRNKTVHGIYDTWTTTISSDEKIPVLLLSGDFYKDTVLQYKKEQDSKGEIPGYRVLDEYTFSVASQNPIPTGVMKVRLLADDYHKNATIAVYEGDRFIPAATQRDGRYLVFVMNGAGKFAVVTQDHSLRNSMAIVVLLLTGFAVFIKVKKKKSVFRDTGSDKEIKEEIQEQQENDVER